MKAPERLLQGAPNARDLGGIITLEGRKVKKSRLIRSGHLCEISDADIETLRCLGLRRIIDLRSTQERSEKPDREILGAEYSVCRLLPEKTAGIVRNTPESEEEEAIRTVAMAKHLMTKNPDGKAQMKSLYPIFVTQPQCVEKLTEFFDILLNTAEGAVLFHCSLGKDRTGICAALVLYALGVSREEIVKDYIKTSERCAEGTERLVESCRRFTDDKAVLSFIRDLDAAEEDFINSAFAAAEEECGSLDSFLEERLGLTADKISRLKELYLD